MYKYGDKLTDKSQFEECSDEDLLARLIYSEAEGECKEGKIGCAFVIKNRITVNLNEFGGNTYKGVILHPSQFAGMNRPEALAPNLKSQAWKDSLDIALNLNRTRNPIKNCLWFNSTKYYKTRLKHGTKKDEYKFVGTNIYRVVDTKVTIGNQTFFHVEGYN